MQFLVGDRIDNIMGVKGIGPKKAYKLLNGLSEKEMFDTCVEQLGSVERAVENGKLLYLQRQQGEQWEPPSEDTERESKGKETTTMDSGTDTTDVPASGE